MPHDVRNPHILQNGVGHTADAEAVMDNYDGLWTATDPAFSTYKSALERSVSATAGAVTTSGTYVLAGIAPVLSSSGGYAGVFDFDPADVAAVGRTTKLRLRATYLTNGTQSGQTATLGLYPVSGVAATAVTLGTVVSGSTVAFANPAVDTRSQGNSGDFTAPAAGYYVIAFATGAAWAGSSAAAITVRLQVRQV